MLTAAFFFNLGEISLLYDPTLSFAVMEQICRAVDLFIGSFELNIAP